MLALWRTTIGKKVVMAVTGIILAGFVVVHMAGNLKLYQGAEVYNEYSRHLREMGTPMLPRSGALNLARAVLLVSLILHLSAAVQLTRLSLAARTVRYTGGRDLARGYAAFAMRWSGLVVFLFAGYHLLHLTFGLTGLGGKEFLPEDVYRNVVNGFSQVPVSAVYILAMAGLGMHLYHGLWSLCQTLGLSRGKGRGALQKASAIVAAIVVAGNVSFPIAVIVGLVK